MRFLWRDNNLIAFRKVMLIAAFPSEGQRACFNDQAAPDAGARRMVFLEVWRRTGFCKDTRLAVFFDSRR